MENQPRALVVDDEEVWLDTLAGELGNVGYIVSKAETREEAEYFLLNYTFDVVTMDVNLTDSSTDEKGEPIDKQGMELISKVRQFAKKRDLAVVIVTGYGTPNVTREAFKKLGVEDILFKQDFNLAEFRKIVEKATANTYLRRAGTMDDAILDTE